MIRTLAIAVSTVIFTSTAVFAGDIRLAVTTSFHNSGLADILLPAIQQDIGLTVQLLVVGTGQALRLGEAGDVDAILVHSKTAEEAFVANGFGTHRREIMYNDFVFIGPSTDPAGIADAASATEALADISTAKTTFVSRGDNSGTHKKELSLWEASERNVDAFGDWYRAVGSGMGASLNTAAGMDAYIMSDRASWLNFGNKSNLALLYSGDPVLFNQYAFLPVNPDLHSYAKNELAMELEGWLTGPHAKKLIDGYTINGETLFVFNAKPP